MPSACRRDLTAHYGRWLAGPRWAKLLACLNMSQNIIFLPSDSRSPAVISEGECVIMDGRGTEADRIKSSVWILSSWFNSSSKLPQWKSQTMFCEAELSVCCWWKKLLSVWFKPLRLIIMMTLSCQEIYPLTDFCVLFLSVRFSGLCWSRSVSTRVSMLLSCNQC